MSRYLVNASFKVQPTERRLNGSHTFVPPGLAAYRNKFQFNYFRLDRSAVQKRPRNANFGNNWIVASWDCNTTNLNLVMTNDALSYGLPESSRANSILIGLFGSGLSYVMSINSCTRLALLAGKIATWSPGSKDSSLLLPVSSLTRTVERLRQMKVS